MHIIPFEKKKEKNYIHHIVWVNLFMFYIMILYLDMNKNETKH